MAALDIDKVLLDEALAIHGEGRISPDLRSVDLYRKLNELAPAALCLSGGGIRSASFALGVIQALASHPQAALAGKKPQASLLAQFHYLSTVSGGGYIGGWLTTWIARARFATVWQRLTSRPDPDQEASEIKWLRSYSNYLTPKLGVLSPDLWADLMIFLRNLILNWLILIPGLCLVVLALKLVALTIDWFGRFSPNDDGDYLPLIPAGVAVFCLLAALWFTTHHRPTRGHRPASELAFCLLDLVPAVLAAFGFTIALAFPATHDALESVPAWLLIVGGAGAGACAYAISWAAALSVFRSARDYWGDLVAWTLAGCLYGAMLGLAVYIHRLTYGEGLGPLRTSELLLFVFAVPWSLLSQLLAEMVFVGLTSYEIDSDADREWLGRAAGWYGFALSAWLILMLLISIGSNLLVLVFTDSVVANHLTAWLAPLGGITGIATSILAKSGTTPATGTAKKVSASLANLALRVAAPLFAAILVIGCSALLDKLLIGKPLTAVMGGAVVESGLPPPPSGFAALMIGLALAAFITFGAARFVNINRFSLHALYRNRIIRAFLGASNPGRRADPFSGFDPDDNPPMSLLWPSRGAASRAESWQPFHVVNMALNLVASKNLAWQERRASCFTASPLHVGNPRTGYRPTGAYAGPKGMTIGTAVAISGAAASPNMGYHSSPSLAFLMTLFNVRMGWWLGNPRSDKERIYGREGPTVALIPLLNEMLGRTTDQSNEIYLSDGGHFENLGLYEMVRRRCRFIVVSDAVGDPDFGFADLADAVRKIRLDLGITITFPPLSRLRPRPADGADLGADQPYHLIGQIDYPAADGSGQKGVVLYIKAGYHGTESADIRGYAVAHPAFPHEGTEDQWFTESQLESYRALGFEITSSICTRIFAALNDPSTANLADVARHLTSQ